MQPERVLRWSALITVPVALGVVALLRTGDEMPVGLSPPETPSRELAMAPAPRGAAGSGGAVVPPSGSARGSQSPGAAGPGPDGVAETVEPSASRGEGRFGTSKFRNVRQPVAIDDLGVAPLPNIAPLPPVDAVSPDRDSAPAPCGGVRVRLITTGADPAWSFASLTTASDAPTQVRHVGDTVGSWRVDAIEWDRVWLVSGGIRCAATLHEEALGASRPVAIDPGDPMVLTAAEGTVPIWQVPAEVARGIQRRSATELVIDPRAADQIFARGGALVAGTRFDPVSEGDQVVGIELGSIAPGSLLDRLGIEPGDVLRTLGDRRATSLEVVAAALAQAHDRRTLVAGLTRGEAEIDLEVVVRDLALE